MTADIIDPDLTRVTVDAWASLRTRRRRIHMPVEQLARAIGYSANSVTGWDKGRARPTLTAWRAARDEIEAAENQLIEQIRADQ